MLAFGAFSLIASLVVVGLAASFRGRFYAIFAGIIAGIQTAAGTLVYPSFAPVAPLAWYLQATVYLHLLTLVWPRPRPSWWRFFVTLPAHFWSGGTVLAL